MNRSDVRNAQSERGDDAFYSILEVCPFNPQHHNNIPLPTLKKHLHDCLYAHLRVVYDRYGYIDDTIPNLNRQFPTRRDRNRVRFRIRRHTTTRSISSPTESDPVNAIVNQLLDNPGRHSADNDKGVYAEQQHYAEQQPSTSRSDRGMGRGRPIVEQNPIEEYRYARYYPDMTEERFLSFLSCGRGRTYLRIKDREMREKLKKQGMPAGFQLDDNIPTRQRPPSPQLPGLYRETDERITIDWDQFADAVPDCDQHFDPSNGTRRFNESSGDRRTMPIKRVRFEHTDPSWKYRSNRLRELDE